jgi:hypothetical protein
MKKKGVSRNFHFLLLLFSATTLAAQHKNEKLNGMEVKQIPITKQILVIRTDFSDDAAYKSTKEKALAEYEDLGMEPDLEFIQDKGFENFDLKHLRSIIPKDYHLTFIFFMDKMTIQHSDHPFLCVYLSGEDFGKSLRVIPKELWEVHANLWLANMDFKDFLKASDGNGIFRGF